MSPARGPATCTPATAGVFIAARRPVAPAALPRALLSCLLSALLSALLAACATPQTDGLLRRPPTTLPLARSMVVPDFEQKEHECGPAALAMALDASGARVTPEVLAPLLVVPELKGSLAPEMLAAARRNGRLAVVLDPDLLALLQEVAEGTPVVVLQNLGLDLVPVWHYAVVVGYDLAAQTVLLQSGGQKAAPLDLRVFERTWARSERWAMVALSPERLPQSVPPLRVFEAAAALERVDAPAARRSYRALTRRAPELAYPWIGLGNTSFAAHDVDEAVVAFREATKVEPRNGDAWNNLATALGAKGWKCEALGAVQVAVGIGGPHLADYRATAAELRARRGPACHDRGLR